MEYRPVGAGDGPLIEPTIHEPAADIRRIAGIVRRQYLLAIAGAVIAAILALAFLWAVEPSYRSNIRILLDEDRTKLLTEISGEVAPTASADEYIATQLAVINSDIVARRVINDLNLSYDSEAEVLRIEKPEIEEGTSARPTIVSSDQLAKADIDSAVVDAVRRSVTAYQVEKSLVIEIAVNDPDPEMAQRLASAFGRAYLTDQLSARFEATRSAGTWLEERINTLRDQSLQASAAVEKFRTENNLVSTDGRLLSDQQLTSLNVQLSAARSSATQAAAKVAVFQDAVNRADVDAILSFAASATDNPESAPIRTLRDDYLQASGRAHEVTARWGADNDQARALQAEVARLKGLVLDEAARILNGYRSDYQVAKSEVEAISDSVASATGQLQADSSTQVQLRSLEQRASSYNALYQDYLARYQEAVQQQTLSLTTGRLISKAELPKLPVFPNKKVILALSLILGVGAGGAIGVGRELMDRTFRTRGDVEKMGVDFLGYAGAVPSSRATRRGKDSISPDAVLDHARQPDIWAAALSSVRIALEIRRRDRSKVIGLISLHEMPARSTLALVYAEREARAGRRVLLLDGDAQAQRLTRALTPEGGPSFLDVLSGALPLEQAVAELDSGVLFLPAAPDTGFGEAINQAAAEQLKIWRSAFDVVVVDLPPAGAISEARALAPGFDGFICTVEWGRTSCDLLSGLLRSSAVFGTKMVGVVITDVAMNKLPLYDPAAKRDRQARNTA